MQSLMVKIRTLVTRTCLELVQMMNKLDLLEWARMEWKHREYFALFHSFLPHSLDVPRSKLVCFFSRKMHWFFFNVYNWKTFLQWNVLFLESNLLVFFLSLKSKPVFFIFESHYHIVPLKLCFYMLSRQSENKGIIKEIVIIGWRLI